MKRFFLAAICALPGLAFAQVAPTGFTVTGKVGSLNAPAKAFLRYSVNGTAVVDSTELKDGKFSFAGKIPDYSSASIQVKHAPAEPGKRTLADALSFYLENKAITVTTADSIKNSKVLGSPVTDESIALKAFVKPASDKMVALNTEYMAKTPAERKEEAYQKSLNDRSDAITAETNTLYGKYAAAHTSTYMGLVAFRTSLGYGELPATAEADYKKFAPVLKTTTLGKTVSSVITAAKFTKVGAMAMAFTQNDPDGKPISLSDFKGKYLLVDFWASWCGPCRQENPNVVAAYNQYKDKNFTILGVSLDQPGKKDLWLKAIKDDGLTWNHVSDLQYWNNAVAKQYGIQSIPANFLIDPTGKIIGKNLRGDDLKKKLAEIFGGQALGMVK